jgi:Alginate lyase
MLLAPSPAWSDANTRGMRTWAEQYLDFLLSPHVAPARAALSSHGTAYDEQLLATLLFLGRHAAARCASAAAARLLQVGVLPQWQAAQYAWQRCDEQLIMSCSEHNELQRYKTEIMPCREAQAEQYVHSAVKMRLTARIVGAMLPSEVVAPNGIARASYALEGLARVAVLAQEAGVDVWHANNHTGNSILVRACHVARLSVPSITRQQLDT